jgi:hypothetical protein
MLRTKPSPMPRKRETSWKRRLRARPIRRRDESWTAASMNTKLRATPTSVKGRSAGRLARPRARPTTTGILASTSGWRRLASSDEATRLQNGMGKIRSLERSWVSLRARPVSIGEIIQKTPTAVARTEARGRRRSKSRAARLRAPK